MASTDSKLDENLYSRLLYAVGHDAVKNFSTSSVLVLGISGLGLNISKCLIMSGIGKVTLLDSNTISYHDLSSNFYANEKDIGKNRAKVVHQKLSQLNPYCQVDIITDGKLPDFSKYTVVVSTDAQLNVQHDLNNECRKSKTLFVGAQCLGLTAQVFVDYGDDFTVKDATGEKMTSGHIVKIEDNIITTTEAHNLSVNNVVKFNEVEGMVELNNGSHKVNKIINRKEDNRPT